MGRFFGSVGIAAPAPVARAKRARAAACELRTEDGDVLLAGPYERCAAEVVKRCKVLYKGQPTERRYVNCTGWRDVGIGKTPNRFAWSIVGPDGAIRSRHAITVLS